MHYALATLLGTGTEDDPFQGSDQPEASIIDLRPIGRVPDGRCLLVTPDRERRASVFYLGDDLDGPSPAIRNGVASRLGLTFRTGVPSLRNLVWELLTEHGRWDATRWNPLRSRNDGMAVVVLGETIRSVRVGPPRPASVVITDNFNRADGDIGSSAEGWSWAQVANGAQVVSNKLRADALVQDSRIRAETNLDTDDQYAQIVFVTWAGGGGDNKSLGAIVRYSAAADTCYVGQRRKNSGSANPVMRILKLVSGATTILATSAQIAISPPEVERIEVNGSSLIAFVDGVNRASVTDTEITGNLRTGVWIRAQGALTDYEGDDFEAGDLEPDSVEGPISVMIPVLDLASTGEAVVQAAGTDTLPALTADATAEATASGAAAQVLPALGADASGTATSEGSVAQALPTLGADASAEASTAGAAAQMLPSLGQSAAGTSHAAGTAAQALPVLGSSADATVQAQAAVAQALSLPTQDALAVVGVFDVEGDVVVVLPEVGSNADALTSVNAGAAQSLPALASSASGGRVYRWEQDFDVPWSGSAGDRWPEDHGIQWSSDA